VAGRARGRPATTPDGVNSAPASCSRPWLGIRAGSAALTVAVMGRGRFRKSRSCFSVKPPPAASEAIVLTETLLLVGATFL